MKEAADLLKQALSERQASNAAYSLRAFARDLQLSPQQLSNVMSGKRGLGAESATRVCRALNFSENEKTVFQESLKAKFAISKTQRVVAKTKLAHLAEHSGAKNLEIDLFKIISNWYHLALLELIKIAGRKTNDPVFLSAKLGIPLSEVVAALGRLERLELISQSAKGWTVNQDTVISDQGTSTEAVRNFHRQIMEKSLHALAFHHESERYGSSSLMPSKVKDLPRAKKLIQDFRLAFANEISADESADEIYGLSIQFFKLTQTNQEKS